MVRGRAVTCTEVARERVPPRGEVGPAVEGCEGEGMGDMGGGRRAAGGKSSGVGRVGGGGRREAQRSREGVGEGRKREAGRGAPPKAALSGSLCKL